jgi:hypothetical protein
MDDYIELLRGIIDAHVPTDSSDYAVAMELLEELEEG